MQALNFWRLGAGHILIIAPSGAFVAVCVAVLVDGGPKIMATLIVLSSLLQFALAYRLSFLRRIFTPVVSGTVIMLISVAVMPFIFDLMNEAPAGVPPLASSLAALTTLVVITAMVMRAPPSWRLWSPLMGIVLGCLVAAPLGLYDFQAVLDAPWIGAPFGSWPGLHLTPDIRILGLLPAFIIVTLVASVQTVGDSVAIQQVSRRRQRATDFRIAQGALNGVGISNVLSGLLGTLPNSTNSTSVSLTEVTGTAARRVGITIGAFFILLAFFPKVTTLLVAIPAPVIAAYLTVLLALLFVQGIRMIAQDGLDHRKAAVVGVSFWLGVGFQSQVVFPSLFTGFWGVLFSNGMTVGAVSAIILTLFLNLTERRRSSIQVSLSDQVLPELAEFLRDIGSKSGWDASSTQNLAAAGEETLAVMLQLAVISEDGVPRRLTVYARPGENSIELEFVTILEGENVEDHLAYLSELPPEPDKQGVSFHLLSHYASAVRHHKYYGVDVVVVNVNSRS